MNGIYLVEPVPRPAPPKPPHRRPPVTWNWRDLDAREQAIVAEGLAQDLEHGLRLVAGRTS